MTGVMLFVTQEAGRLVVLIPPVCEPDWVVNEQVILEIRTVPVIRKFTNMLIVLEC